MQRCLHALRCCHFANAKLPSHSAVQSRASASARIYFNPRRTYASTVLAGEIQFGQPVHETHPHLLRSGERASTTIYKFLEIPLNRFTVTPGITALEYAQRRTKLASKLPPGAIAIVAASDVKYRSGAVFYEYHQDSNFFYLTGTRRD